MQGSWRLLKTWSINEIPNRAPPLPAHVLHAMVGWAWFHGHFTFGVSLLLGFYGMLRTGEVLGLRASHLFAEPGHTKAIVSLGLTKGGKRQGAAESIVVGFDWVVRVLTHWKSKATPTTPFATTAAQWRKLFNDSLVALKLTEFNFRPYSLRRGGATWWFSKHHSLDQILIQGRWQAAKTARMYLNEGLFVLAELKLPASYHTLRPFLHVFSRHQHSPNFQTLSPPSSKGRKGGRGRGRPKNVFPC